MSNAKRFRVKARDREYFALNLALLFRAGVPAGEALQSLWETSHSKQLKGALEQMKNDIDEGLPFWKALKRSGTVTNQTLALVKLGEESGNLIENLLVAAKQEEKQHAFIAKIRSALLYPAFVLGITGVIGLGVTWFLLPRLAAAFTQLDIKLPLISQIMINFGIFLRDNGIWAVPLTIMSIFALGYILFAAPKTRHIGQRLLFHTPGVSQLLYEIEIARFGYLLGTLLQAGLSITQAFELLHDATTSRRYQALYAYLGRSFEEGYSFRMSLPRYQHTTKLLPSTVQQVVIAGESSGALPETLLNLGTIYEAKADTSIQNLEVMIEPILLVIVWLGVLGVAIAVILPIYSLVGGLNGKQ